MAGRDYGRRDYYAGRYSSENRGRYRRGGHDADVDRIPVSHYHHRHVYHRQMRRSLSREYSPESVRDYRGRYSRSPRRGYGASKYYCSPRTSPRSHEDRGYPSRDSYECERWAHRDRSRDPRGSRDRPLDIERDQDDRDRDYDYRYRQDERFSPEDEGYHRDRYERRYDDTGRRYSIEDGGYRGRRHENVIDSRDVSRCSSRKRGPYSDSLSSSSRAGSVCPEPRMRKYQVGSDMPSRSYGGHIDSAREHSSSTCSFKANSLSRESHHDRYVDEGSPGTRIRARRQYPPEEEPEDWKGFPQPRFYTGKRMFYEPWCDETAWPEEKQFALPHHGPNVKRYMTTRPVSSKRYPYRVPWMEKMQNVVVENVKAISSKLDAMEKNEDVKAMIEMSSG